MFMCSAVLVILYIQPRIGSNLQGKGNLAIKKYEYIFLTFILCNYKLNLLLY